eukprot:m.92661 g.92661  ORF g.92661 m.92661 type:complete len:76 (-) comp16521_c0_seq28:1611-1838(-)
MSADKMRDHVRFVCNHCRHQWCSPLVIRDIDTAATNADQQIHDSIEACSTSDTSIHRQRAQTREFIINMRARGCG